MRSKYETNQIVELLNLNECQIEGIKSRNPKPDIDIKQYIGQRFYIESVHTEISGFWYRLKGIDFLSFREDQLMEYPKIKTF